MTGLWLMRLKCDVRWLHSVWESPSGLVLLGGYSSPRTTERIGEDGRSSYSFPLEYDV